MQYIKIDDIIAALIRLGRGTYLPKTVIEYAFSQFSVHPDDWELLGMYWNNSYYFDKVLPFGLRSAPYIFNQLSDALEWILLNKCFIAAVASEQGSNRNLFIYIYICYICLCMLMILHYSDMIEHYQCATAYAYIHELLMFSYNARCNLSFYKLQSLQYYPTVFLKCVKN